jgi:hypothetical protein
MQPEVRGLATPAFSYWCNMMYEGPRYYDKEGYPLDLLHWIGLMAVDGYVSIKRTRLRGGKLVSTAWIGLDYNVLEGEGMTPLIFETAVFSGYVMVSHRRATTKEEALDNHEVMCKRYTYNRYQRRKYNRVSIIFDWLND